MTQFAAFLRGVNVGGVTLTMAFKMADMATALNAAGFAQVRTILASGNVLLESASGVATVREKAEAALRESFGYDARVFAYDIDTVRAIDAAYPFEREVDGHHSYVWIVYWQVPKGATLDSTIGKTMGKPRYKSSTTTRNLRTLAKMLH